MGYFSHFEGFDMLGIGILPIFGHFGHFRHPSFLIILAIFMILVKNDDFDIEKCSFWGHFWGLACGGSFGEGCHELRMVIWGIKLAYIKAYIMYFDLRMGHMAKNGVWGLSKWAQKRAKSAKKGSFLGHFCEGVFWGHFWVLTASFDSVIICPY